MNEECPRQYCHGRFHRPAWLRLRQCDDCGFIWPTSARERRRRTMRRHAQRRMDRHIRKYGADGIVAYKGDDGMIGLRMAR